jgi:predicted O-methyltransferase YrrM
LEKKIAIFWFRIKEVLIYLWTSQTIYDIHSPFVFDFIQNVLEEKKRYYSFTILEDFRQHLLRQHNTIEVSDFGAGSQVLSTKVRKISAIAQSSLSRPFFCQILFSTVHWLQPKRIVELGTSLGIATLYMAKASEKSRILTLEGCPQIAQTAQKHFEQLNTHNIEVIIGNFDQTLQATLQSLNVVQLFVIDGNHQYEATLRYFEQCLEHSDETTCFIFDDIYWSPDMKAAWEKIKAHSKVSLSIDIFQYGLVFLRREQVEKQHFTLIPSHYKPWRMGFFA